MELADVAVNSGHDVGLASTSTLARHRSLPLDDAFAGLFPDPGLVRGRIVACTGAAGMSLALALATRATAAGSWLAVVGVPAVGVEAARELGVAVERMVAIGSGGSPPAEWADHVVAAADGFELILTRPPAGAERVIRKVHQRLQARGAVLLAVDARAGADVTVDVTVGEWEGLGGGHGHLRRRRVVVRATGRRIPLPRECELWLPGAGGRPEALDAAITAELERTG